MEDITALGERLEIQTARLKEYLFSGTAKKAPEFNATKLAELCGRSRDQMLRLLDRGLEPGLSDGIKGKADGGSERNRRFTLSEARAWVKATRKPGRPPGLPGATITVANFKGGVSKTVTAMSTAQALSLKGYDVLCIDYDPQGSMSALFGLTPGFIPESETVLPLMMHATSEIARDTLQESIQATYWDGIDLVPASHAIAQGEFYLPLRQLEANNRGEEFKFWDVLNKALDAGIREQYDYIIIDTPPALSYMNMTTIWAADALLLPLPPEGIDFVSSAQFWTMLSELSTGLALGQKDFAWVAAVPSKVNHQRMYTKEILKWMQGSYGDMLTQTEIPDTAAVGMEGAKYSTVYDVERYAGSAKTLSRARDAYDKLVDEIDFMTRRKVWQIPATEQE
ncbi:Plasmid partition protein A (plasmid) [Variovorax sp. PBL-E5]|nr:Plasmid partition protein A [Variovorax sp. SRS16]VTU41472.1 Plasmid partition protein A [Variovorax sp. PBL-E5]